MDDSILDTLKPLLDSIHLTPDLLEDMKSHAQQGFPEEVCGVISGRIDQGHYDAVQVYPIKNILHSPRRFRMDPHEQIQAFNHIQEMGLELIGIYHSHPSGPPNPSETDLQEAYYPECAYLIWSHHADNWFCKVFRLQEGKFIEIDLNTV